MSFSLWVDEPTMVYLDNRMLFRIRGKVVWFHTLKRVTHRGIALVKEIRIKRPHTLWVPMVLRGKSKVRQEETDGGHLLILSNSSTPWWGSVHKYEPIRVIVAHTTTAALTDCTPQWAISQALGPELIPSCLGNRYLYQLGHLHRAQTETFVTAYVDWSPLRG